MDLEGHDHAEEQEGGQEHGDGTDQVAAADGLVGVIADGLVLVLLDRVPHPQLVHLRVVHLGIDVLAAQQLLGHGRGEVLQGAGGGQALLTAGEAGDPFQQHLDPQFQALQVDAVLGGVVVVGGVFLGVHGFLADEGTDVLLQLRVADLVAHGAHAVDEELLAIGEERGEVVHEVGHEGIAAPPVLLGRREAEVHAANGESGLGQGGAGAG
ncbi:hypothetical protein D3C84_578010 [compost metagenome]